MRNRNRRWLLAWTLASLFPHIMLYEVSSDDKGNSSARGVFSPRMDYEQWTPLGRGDPLKNDPTYDYVPPVLDRVHYWIDPPSRKPDTQKTEILVLGVSSKKPSSTGATITADSRRDTQQETFLKFVEGPKFGNYQRMSKPHHSTSSFYYPSLIYPSKNMQYEKVPYTMLMPPPLEHQQQAVLNSLTTEYPMSSSSFQQANLLYQASTLGNQDEFKDKFASLSGRVTWRTPLKNFDPTFVRFPNSNNSTGDDNIKTITSLIGDRPQLMHKGQVDDDELDLQNTYVNIGKPEAQMHSPTDVEISSASMEPFRPSTSPHHLDLPNMRNSDFRTPTVMMTKPQITPMTLQTMKAPISQAPSFHKMSSAGSLQSLLLKETTLPVSTTTTTSLTTDPLFKHYKQPVAPLKGPMYLIIQGHSKVKTYGPGKQIHGIAVVQESSNEIPTSEEKGEYAVKHLHVYNKKDVNEGRLRQGRSSKLQTLSHVVQTGLGAIEFSEMHADRRNDDVQEAELVARYDVSESDGGGGTDTTSSERYYKGIVESARNIK